jgi:hypothetical protein
MAFPDACARHTVSVRGEEPRDRARREIVMERSLKNRSAIDAVTHSDSISIRKGDLTQNNSKGYSTSYTREKQTKYCLWT